MCLWSTSTFETHVGVLPWKCRSKVKWPSKKTGEESSYHKWLASRKIWSVEELETLPAGTESRTPHHRSRDEVERMIMVFSTFPFLNWTELNLYVKWFCGNLVGSVSQSVSFELMHVEFCSPINPSGRRKEKKKKKRKEEKKGGGVYQLSMFTPHL